jgi:hypothetical protein
MSGAFWKPSSGQSCLNMPQSDGKLAKVRTFLQTIQGFSSLGVLQINSEKGWNYEHLLDRGHGALRDSERALVEQLISGFESLRPYTNSEKDWTEIVWMDSENIFYLFRIREDRAAIVHFRTEQVPRFGVGLLAHLKRNLASLIN